MSIKWVFLDTFLGYVQAVDVSVPDTFLLTTTFSRRVGQDMIDRAVDGRADSMFAT
jgi:hypothetical protein